MKPNPGSQHDVLLKAFQRGKKLTVLNAIDNYGVYALSQRCGELKRKYHIPIQSKIIKVASGKHVAQYWL